MQPRAVEQRFSIIALVLSVWCSTAQAQQPSVVVKFALAGKGETARVAVEYNQGASDAVGIQYDLGFDGQRLQAGPATSDYGSHYFLSSTPDANRTRILLGNSLDFQPLPNHSVVVPFAVTGGGKQIVPSGVGLQSSQNQTLV